MKCKNDLQLLIIATLSNRFAQNPEWVNYSKNIVTKLKLINWEMHIL